jgi:hypothetical protein
VRGELRRTAIGGELASGCAVEVIKLPLNGVGLLIKFVDCSARVFRLTALELDVTLLRRGSDDLLPLFECLRTCNACWLAAPISYMLTVAIESKCNPQRRLERRTAATPPIWPRLQK